MMSANGGRIRNAGKKKVMAIQKTIRFENGLSLRLTTSGRRFLGIGEVRAGRTLLRSPELPWTVYTESETGIRFAEFELQAVHRAADETTTIVFSGTGQWMPRIQGADAMGDARIKTRRVEAPVATFRWTFRPIIETIAENTWVGLAMQVAVKSPGNPVNWLIEDATWEIGGEAAGCTLIQQDISTADLEQAVAADSEFSTIEKFHKDGGQEEIHPMDMMPRSGGAAICDFQVKNGVAMCLFAEHPGLTRARLEKIADENVIHYTDRPFFPLTEKAQAPERKLLVYRQKTPLQKHEWRNLWLDCFTEVRRRICSSYGFNLEVPRPEVHAHLWDPFLKELGARWTDALREALPEYQRLGYKDIFTHGVWESVTSDESPGIEGNICCPYAFRYAEQFGGNAVMKKLTKRAHELGLALFQWFGFQFSNYAPIWKKHPEWLLREANGDPWDGAYQILWCGRMRSEFRQHVLDQIRKVRDSVGLDGVFWDSYHNLGLTCVDWQAPDQAPQADEIWKLQVELQRHGYRQRCEAITVFGVSSVGMFGFHKDTFRRRLWSESVRRDEAFALFDCSPAFYCENGALGPGKVSPREYFWLAGHRVIPGTDASPWGNADAKGLGPSFLPGGELAEEYGKVNHIYNAVVRHMHRLRVTAGGKYTLWLDEANRPAVVWAFADAEFPFSGTVTELPSNRVITSSRAVAIKAGSVYVLQAERG
jgi:hypothetical protein